MPPGHAGRPRSVTLPGAATLTPREQGSYDGLCGLYAIVNALTLALTPHGPLTLSQMHKLFTTGLRTLDQAHMLHAAVRDGMPLALWHGIIGDLCATAATLTSLPVDAVYALSPRVTRATMFNELETSLRGGQTILLPVEGVLSHYTVISGYTPSGLRLFDSAGLRWLKRTSCRIDVNDRRFRHRLDVNAARVIRAGAAADDG